ncbi:MAG: hypothetical protein ACHREM_05095 [Polyangiales bacterium]
MTGVVVAKILKELERYYDAAAQDVQPFLRVHDEGASSAREALLVRHDDDAVEIALVLPDRLATAPWSTLSFDDRCQLVEGASHFLVVCERARRELPTTHLELEIQAEVDKWLVLSRGGRLAPDDDDALHAALFDDPDYFDDAGSEAGDRYRMANRVAAKLVRRLSRDYARAGRFTELRGALHRFFHAGQAEKLASID